MTSITSTPLGQASPHLRGRLAFDFAKTNLALCNEYDPMLLLKALAEIRKTIPTPMTHVIDAACLEMQLLPLPNCQRANDQPQADRSQREVKIYSSAIWDK